ncbi:tetratricopeptide repeat protein [Sphingomonas sp. AX6]|uniref:tetratricopeptide repeat protein n=1 Tax=Sphingomonas sp. AX6 TaxID=2653171 RepID=UPI002E27C13D|nr:tetratricopeptide repeat protein [Sphingomonas sp. AX6]
MALALLASGSAWSAPALAQSAVEGRVDRLEREMRAVQRKVFPGGSGQIVTPDITAPQMQTNILGSPATGAISNLESRVSAIESQFQTITGQIEQGEYRIRQLEQQFEAYKRATDAKLSGMGSAPAATTNGSGGPAAANPPRVSASTATTAASPARREAIAAVQKPDTGDAVEDQYTYGFRLWQAQLYPEAQAALKQVVDKNPTHRRASYAQNLIGRSYLDDGKPSLASIAFYDNYKKMPDGERAADSLFYLAQALVQLKKPSEACDVYAELEEVYPTRISGSMKADITRGRTAARCS